MRKRAPTNGRLPDARVDAWVSLTAAAVGALVAVLEQTLADRRLSYASQGQALDVLAGIAAQLEHLAGSEDFVVIPTDSPLWGEFQRRRK